LSGPNTPEKFMTSQYENKSGLFRIALLALFLVLALAAKADAAPANALEKLKNNDISEREAAVEMLVNDPSPVAAEVLKALMDGDLYVLKKENQLVIAKKDGKDYAVSDPLEGRELGSVKKRDLRKVGSNNAMRGMIRAVLGKLDLASPDPAARRAAAGEMISHLDQMDSAFLNERLNAEDDALVREKLEAALAVKTLSEGAGKEARAAVKTLAGNLNPEVRRALTKLKDETQNPGLKAAITKVLGNIQSKVEFFSFLETLFFGLSMGSVLVLAAIGLAITFGVMGVINMAHGELIMLGAYATYVIQQQMPGHIGLSLFVAIPAAFLVSGLTGILIERLIIRFLYGRPLETLLATFGVSLVLQQAVRSIFSPLNRSVATPEWMSGSLAVNPVFSLTWNRMYIIVFCVLVFAALFAVLSKTRLGLEVRAVSQNRAMARAMGTRAALVDALTFGLGAGIAGVAGVALSQLTNVGPNLGQAYIIDSFMVVVFGGVGNLWGTMVAGLSLGVINKVLEPVSGAVLAKILVLVFIILFIQKRPTGLFPQKGRAVEG
jgi:urea transport system permease protein